MKRACWAVILAVALGGCGPAPPTLSGGKPVTHWVEALRDPDARQRRTAAFKLGNAGPADAAVLPALVEALRDPEAAVRREAIVALVKFGPGAREATGTLNNLRELDPDPGVRADAARALERLGRDE
jgi:HEAT repeat protein